VIDGKVKVGRTADDGRQVVVDIYLPDKLFGESGFIGQQFGLEHAVAVETTKVMIWSPAQIEDLVVRQSHLSIALIQLVVKRCTDFAARIEAFPVALSTGVWFAH
jgi:CRP-like cAMP-binding protein